MFLPKISCFGRGQKQETVKEDESILDQTLLSPEIMECILAHVDVQRLKTCRFVCKSWNTEACRALRKRSFVYCKDPQEMETLMELARRGKRLRLPTPFQDMTTNMKKVEVPEEEQRALFYKNVKSIFGDSGIYISKLALDEGRNEFGVSLLMHFCSTLTRVALNCTWERDLLLMQDLDGLSFPQLESLNVTIEPWEGESCWEEFVAKVIDSAPKLVALKIQGCVMTEGTEGRPVLQSCDLGRIQRLTLLWGTNTFFEWQYLKFVGSPKFKYLTLGLNTYIYKEEMLTNQLLELLSNFADTLLYVNLFEVNNLDYQKFQERFPYCPKVVSLVLPKFRAGSGFLRQLPRLKCLNVRNCGGGGEEQEASSCFFENLDELILDTLTESETYSSKQVLIQLCLQFPKVKKWELSPKCLFHEEFTTLGNEKMASFSKEMEKLTLYSWQPDDDFKLLQKVKGQLGHWQGLKELVLEWCVRDDFVQVFIFKVIKQLPNLQILRFYWNDDLNFQGVAKELKHLKQVYVENCCKRKYKKLMEQFFLTLPQGNCGCCAKKNQLQWPVSD